MENTASLRETVPPNPKVCLRRNTSTVFRKYRDYLPPGRTRGRLRRTRATQSHKTYETMYYPS